MGKQNQYRFNLMFDESDIDHRHVAEYLNACGRKKARYVVKAILAYWALQDGKYSSKEPELEQFNKHDSQQDLSVVQSRVIDLDDDYKIEPSEAELMKQNYSVFDIEE